MGLSWIERVGVSSRVGRRRAAAVQRKRRLASAAVCRCVRTKLHFPDRGAIAQLGERLDRTQEVAGSSPASSTPALEVRSRCRVNMTTSSGSASNGERAWAAAD